MSKEATDQRRARLTHYVKKNSLLGVNSFLPDLIHSC